MHACKPGKDTMSTEAFSSETSSSPRAMTSAVTIQPRHVQERLSKHGQPQISDPCKRAFGMKDRGIGLGPSLNTRVSAPAALSIIL